MWITSIIFQVVRFKGNCYIRKWCVEFTIGMRCNISPVITRMRSNPVLDCVVCLSTHRTCCTRMRLPYKEYYDNFPLVKAKSPWLLSSRWKNIPAWILQYQNRRCFQQGYLGGRLRIKMSSYQYRDPHVKDKTVSTVLSLQMESPYLGKTVFILRQGPENIKIQPVSSL